MTIEYDKKGYVIHQNLNKTEARMFYAFLKQEKSRHQEDIDHIDLTLDYLSMKFYGEMK